MRLYEATDVVPGVSITLRDVLEGGTVTVAERTLDPKGILNPGKVL